MANPRWPIAKQPESKYCAVRLAPAPDAPAAEPTFARTVRSDRLLRRTVVATTNGTAAVTTAGTR